MKTPLKQSFTFVYLALVLATGCVKQPDEPVAFETRLQAAMGISTTSERDEALMKVAVDAAKEGKDVVVQEAVRGISSSRDKDRAAHDSALELAKAGNGPGAVEIAEMISQTSLRNEALRKLAK